MTWEMALNLYLSVFFVFGAGFGLFTFAHRHLFSEGPNKAESTPGGPTVASRVLWVMVCTFLWPIMLFTGLHSVVILAKRKRQPDSAHR